MNLRNSISVLLVLCFIFGSSSAGLNCSSWNTCGLCIQQLDCAWCTSPVVSDTSRHCIPKSEANTAGGGACMGPIENPKSNVDITQNDTLSETQSMGPQKIVLKLRKNEKIQIPFQYMQSKNYPVDMYYLLDVSHSMEPSKDKLAKFGLKIAKAMQTKTTDFQIGFGTFVDKLTLPYTNTHSDEIKDKQDCKDCVPSHSFINKLNLTNDYKLFSETVNNTKMSTNLDTPEGGLDAIMQAMVCQTVIGWRDNSRHLLVMSTDASSHIAGDGKLGGVVEPNDAKCHLKNDEYTEGLVYDYPSLSHINYIAQEKFINLIFAIVMRPENAQLELEYKALSNVIANSKSGTLKDDSEDVVQFLSKMYDDIRDAVTIKAATAQDEVSVKISANRRKDCEEGSCTNVNLGEIIDFTAEIEPLVCHNDPKLNKRTITVRPEGLVSSLVIQLEVLCECQCSNKREPKHETCNKEGDLECGVCRCNEGRTGDKCECEGSNINATQDTTKCVKPGDSKDVVCSGRGVCSCGQCYCTNQKEVLGTYCECSNSNCPASCSGNGICECGVCKCNNGFTGDDCHCSSQQSSCMAPGSSEICSGHGDCNCNKCTCQSGNDTYTGDYCETCTSCDAPMCEELRPCVECHAYKTGKYANSDACKDNCTYISSRQIVEKLNSTAEKYCQFAYKDCMIKFQYSSDENKRLTTIAEEKPSCPEPPPLIPIIAGVIGSVVLIGLMTLIVWKVLTTIHDKREYARFLKDRQNTTFGGMNPLYNYRTTRFSNTAYGRRSQRISVGGLKRS